jgi:hypothetical protein
MERRATVNKFNCDEDLKHSAGGGLWRQVVKFSRTGVARYHG